MRVSERAGPGGVERRIRGPIRSSARIGGRARRARRATRGRTFSCGRGRGGACASTRVTARPTDRAISRRSLFGALFAIRARRTRFQNRSFRPKSHLLICSADVLFPFFYTRRDDPVPPRRSFVRLAFILVQHDARTPARPLIVPARSRTRDAPPPGGRPHRSAGPRSSPPPPLFTRARAHPCAPRTRARRAGAPRRGAPPPSSASSGSARRPRSTPASRVRARPARTRSTRTATGVVRRAFLPPSPRRRGRGRLFSSPPPPPPPRRRASAWRRARPAGRRRRRGRIER